MTAVRGEPGRRRSALGLRLALAFISVALAAVLATRQRAKLTTAITVAAAGAPRSELMQGPHRWKRPNSAPARPASRFPGTHG